jgi:uncharacterized membrane protein
MGSRRRRSLAVVAIVIVGVLAPAPAVWAHPPAQEAAYTIVAVGVPEGFTSSDARAINDEGVAAGFAENPEERTRHAWTFGNGELHDRNRDSEASDAWGINDAGQIVGAGYHDGEKRGFILTPVDAC